MADLIPGSKLDVLGQLWRIDERGKRVPDVAGPVTAHLANTKNGGPADPSLVALCTNLGRGKWLFTISGDVLTPMLLRSLFFDARPYLIVDQTNGPRTALALSYGGAS